MENGLYRFYSGESTHGELSREEMREVLEFAEQHGWRRAVDEKMKKFRSIAAQLVSDPRRRHALVPLKQKGGRVLDFGCGYGAVSRALAEEFDEVVALDGSLERVSLLNVARRQDGIANIRTVCHNDVLHLPFADESFDVIVLVGVFEYLPAGLPNLSIEAAHINCLQSFLRVLKPGGQILLQTKNRFGWNYFQGMADHSGVRFAPVFPRWLVDLRLRLAGRGPNRIINYSDTGYRNIMSAAGFKDVELYWPVPGYQYAEHVIDLQNDVVSQVDELRSSYFPPLRSAVIAMLARLGLLSKFVPTLSVLATKPG